MSAIEEARAALAELIRLHPQFDPVAFYAEAEETFARLGALIEPPADDEREALATVLTNAEPNSYRTGERTFRDWMLEYADNVLAAGFRRQGPITDAQVVAAMRAYWGTSGSRTSAVAMRAALEAARAV